MFHRLSTCRKPAVLPATIGDRGSSSQEFVVLPIDYPSPATAQRTSGTDEEICRSSQGTFAAIVSPTAASVGWGQNRVGIVSTATTAAPAAAATTATLALQS